MMRRKAFILSIVILGGIYIGLRQRPVARELIYVDRLVYLKATKSLFSGTLKVTGNITTYKEEFSEGIPCGEWSEYDKYGGIIHKGKYLTKTILGAASLNLIATDTFVIDHWQEGELPGIKYPPFISFLILKDDVFFEKDQKYYDEYFKLLVNAFYKDTRELKYDYISVSFANSIFEPSKIYSKEYRIDGNKLVDKN